MKAFVVVILFAFAQAKVITSDCVTINHINYEKELVRNGFQNPYQLTIDHDTNTLFFSYTARSDEMFKIAYLSLKTEEYGIVTGIRGGFANAVNSKSHVVYMGGDDGVYQYDYDTKKATNLYIKNNTNIWQMFYKDGLYFTTYPDETAYLYKDTQVVEVPEVKNIRVMTMAVDKDDNIVYSNSSGLFLYKKTDGTTNYLKDLVVNGFSADIDGNLYFSTASGIYRLNEQTKEVDELVKIDNTFGFAIESNGDFIYASHENIVRLKQSKKSCNEDLNKVEENPTAKLKDEVKVK